MATAALVLYGITLTLTFGVRIALQVRRTGSTGVRGLPAGASPVEWLAGGLFIAGLAAGAAAPLLVLLDVLEPIAALDGPVGHVLGILLAATGIVLTFLAQLAMGDEWRIGVDPEERTGLVTDGPFGLVRNPIYSAMLPTVLGLVLMVPNVVSLLALAVLAAGLELQVRRVEEPYLLRAHGDEYAAYAARVGRFVPGVGLLRAPLLVAVALLAAAVGAPAAVAATPDPIAWMYQPDAVVEIHLGGLSEEELDALEAEPDEYRKGTFELTVNGVTKGVPLVDVGIRRKGGFGSSRPIKTGKSGLKVRFDEFVDDQLFFGIKRLTLNNMFQDESMVHETLTYELFHEVGLPASRTGYAFVTLNGADYGLFLNLETLDEISLPQWFPTTGHLYEADQATVDVKPGAAGAFEVDEGDDEDLSDLEALIAAANDDEGDWSDGMDAVADLERMTAHWAVERYVAHWDGYAGEAGVFRPNNYYLHSDATGIFQMLPWGTDQTWEAEGLDFEEPAGGLMFNECLADASCRQLYLEGLMDVHCQNLGLDQGAHAAWLAAMLDPYQDREDPGRRGYTAEQIADEVENAEEFAALREEQLEEYLTAEGLLGGGQDPCGTIPSLPRASEPLASPPPPLQARRLWIGPSRVRGRVVSTRLNVPGPGSAVQRVTTRLDGQRLTACGGRASRMTPGPIAVRCRLSKRVHEAFEAGRLELRIRVGFVPASGGPTFELRRLDVPDR